MSKSIYEEALELLNNGCDGPDAFDTYKIALEQAQKQEKLLKLYKILITDWDGLSYKGVCYIYKQIRELENE